MRKKIFYVLVFALAFVSTHQLASQNRLFEEGQQAYNSGNYQQAIDAYMSILKEGKHSTALYYNLANAHYKKGDVAHSIYYYEKALQLSPNDDDVQNNLKFAQQMTIDKITPLPKTWLSRVGTNILSWHTADGWGIQAIVCMILFVLSFLAYYLLSAVWQKRLFFTLMLVFVISSIGSYWIGTVAQTQEQQVSYGILFDKVVHVYAEPNTYSQEVFTLHEGTKTEITDRLNDWLRIKIADGKTGWVKSSTMRVLHKSL